MSIKVTYELRRHSSRLGSWWEIYASYDGVTESCVYQCDSHEEAVAILQELREEG